MPQFKVVITGTVQGVGFRPFVFRTARMNNIKGYVRNSGNSVELMIDGSEHEIGNFLDTIKNNRPPLSKIEKIEIKPCKDKKFSGFSILESEKQGNLSSIMPPDVCICDACLNEVLDRTNRRYRYPFTVCTDCGPRFSIIRSLPYDRENTTMSGFDMCARCRKEYLDPYERRFRAEPVCCPDCGPSYELYGGRKNTFSKDPIRDAAFAIDNGKIVAIKGIGGTHFVAGTDEAISRMRGILKRPQKPFAIMAKNLEEARKIAFISKKEERLLTSIERPIVLLSKKNNIPGNISPGLSNIGIMLPYSGLHHLLFQASNGSAFVMTSANSPGEPVAIENEEILSSGADLSLLHNREIRNRCDDSVIKMVNDKGLFLRRSRGFVPSPIDVKTITKGTVLSLGAELDVTACILKNNKAFLTQYIGNTTRPGTLEFLGSAVDNLLKMTGVEKIDAVAVDKHPSFNTSILGEELSRKFDVPLIKCQHHFAHAASLQAESGIERMVCITADGAGYGNDGNVWGGEIIAVGDNGFEKAGNLLPQMMPGGDLAARYPARMAAGILSRKFRQSELSRIFAPYFGKDELEILLKQIDTGFNSPLTSSTGRILDSIAVLLGICHERTYEGEPAMKLEAFSSKGRDIIDMPVKIRKMDGRYVFDTTGIIEAVYLAREQHSFPDIAASARSAVAEGLCEMAVKAARDKKIGVIGFSGGVGYNAAIINNVRKKANEEGLEFVTHANVPCGDGGISLGQAVIGSKKVNRDSM